MTGKAPAPLWLHAALALAVSYGLSLFFWFGLGVFNLAGFVIISALAAALGLTAGWRAHKKLWITALATLVVRLMLYVVMTRGS